MINIEQIKDKLQNRKLSTVGRHTFFSVLVPFVEIDGEIHILYEIRSQVIPPDQVPELLPGVRLLVDSLALPLQDTHVINIVMYGLRPNQMMIQAQPTLKPVLLIHLFHRIRKNTNITFRHHCHLNDIYSFRFRSSTCSNHHLLSNL